MAPSPPLNIRIGVPSLTLSPTLTRIFSTVPDDGAGTSMVALSDSSVSSGSSALIASPSLTRISMIGTSLKSPMSGTVTWVVPAARASVMAVIVVSFPVSLLRAGSADIVQTVIGLGFSGSSPYFAIASATTLGSTAPSSASDLSAATVTQCRSTSKKWRSFRR